MIKKKYFWLKLNEHFFEQKEIKKLRRMEGGDTSVLIYLKMQLRSLQNGGKIFFEGFEDNIWEELALDLDEKEEDVKRLFDFLKKYNLIEEISKDEFLISKVPELLGEESSAAERMRRSRERRSGKGKDVTQMSQCYTDVTSSVTEDVTQMSQCYTDVTKGVTGDVTQMSQRYVDIDIDKDIDKDIEEEIHEEKEIHKEREFERENNPCVSDTTDLKKVFMKLPLKNNKSFYVTEADITEWSKCYPNADVKTEILKMRAWCLANPNKCKTENNIQRFIIGWLARAVERLENQKVKDEPDFLAAYDIDEFERQMNNLDQFIAHPPAGQFDFWPSKNELNLQHAVGG